MENNFKQKLSRIIPNIHFCRPDKSKSSSQFPGNTIPTAIHRMSSVVPKSFDMSFPSFTAPCPPSTPDRSFTRSSHHVGKSRQSGREDSSEPKKSRRNSKRHAMAKSSKKVCSEETVAPLLADTSISLSDVYSSPDFFSDMSSLIEALKTPQTSTTPRLMPRMPEGKKVRESMAAVVKRSDDPMEDFRRSMWEMVMEKETLTMEDLEQLLLCFLSLNSQKYHPVIVEAFSEIWQVLFSNHHNQHSSSRPRRVFKSSKDQQKLA